MSERKFRTGKVMDLIGVLRKFALIILFWLNYYATNATSVIIAKYTCAIAVTDLKDSKYGIILEPKALKLKAPTKGVFNWKDKELIYIGCGNGKYERCMYLFFK